MAIARMLKTTVIGHAPVLDDVVMRMQDAGVLEIVARDAVEESLPAVDVDEAALHRLDELAADASFVRDFLGRFHTSERPFKTFVSEKFHLSYQEYRELTPDAAFVRLYRECVTLADHLAHAERETAALRAQIHDLEPWRELHLQISRWGGTRSVALVMGIVSESGAEQLRVQLQAEVPETDVISMRAAGSREAWVVLTHRSCEGAVRALLATSELLEVAFPDLTDYPAEEIARAGVRIEELARESVLHRARADELAVQHYAQAVAMVEAIGSDRDAVAMRGAFAHTDRAFTVEGWVQEDATVVVLDALAPLAESLDVSFVVPTPDDTPPVELKNPIWLKPFELLTDLYGRPRYGEIDPTPLHAPFFLLFFAICVGDVGYGAMLIAGAWYIKYRIDVAPGVKRFMDLLMFGGAAAMVVGVLFGSYLALDISLIPAPLKALQVINPIEELTTLLLFTVALGLTQVLFGVAIAVYDAFRRGDPAEAVFGQLSTVFLFIMIGVASVAGVVGVSGVTRAALVVGLIGTMVMKGRTLEAGFGNAETPPRDRVLGLAWLAITLAWTTALALGVMPWATWAFLGMTALGLFISPTVRKAVIALLTGAYGVYSMTGFIGDILSYTRLAALGLSGSIVGMVFNILAGLVLTPGVGLIKEGGFDIVFGIIVVLMGAVVFAFGHVFNVVISLLGAFVHPARLQFVEFFSKFYEAGGRPLAPFARRTGNLVLHAGKTGRSEGGT